MDCSRLLSVETLVAAYKAEGIASLEDLARRYLADSERARCAKQRPDLSRFRRPPRPEFEASIVHRPPELPFVLNGTLYDPKDIKRFDGHELHFVVGYQHATDEILAVDDRGELGSLVHAAVVANRGKDMLYDPIGPLEPADGSGGSGDGPGPQIVIPTPGMGGPESVPGYFSTPVETVMYSDVDYGGAIFSVDRNSAYRDLTSVYIFWPFDDWNDEISSLGGCNSTCGYSDHVNFEGNSLVLFPHSGVPNLVPLGWNDRISSVQNWG
jgi:hypothetical protein